MKGSPEDIMLRSYENGLDKDDEFYPRSPVHAYARNAESSSWNQEILDTFDGVLYTAEAQDVEKVPPCQIWLLFHFGIILSFSHFEYKSWCKGSAQNSIDITDGLTNGAMDTVPRVILDDSQDTTLSTKIVKMRAILAQFDSPKAGQYAIANSKIANCTSIPITRFQAIFMVQGLQWFHSLCTQFPLFLVSALTVHKYKGITMKEIVVDMCSSKGQFQCCQAYVALSQITTLEKLYILNDT